jgi:phytoene dehydrogenase-like protein
VVTEVDAVVVGSGPNGLAAAITVASAGRSVLVLEAADRPGGAMRTDEVSPGVWRDHCAAVFPFAAGSPFLSSLPLADHGLEWLTPERSFGHPLGGDRAAVAHLSVDTTAERLGPDASHYRRAIGRLANRWDALAAEVMQPLVHVPHHPVLLAQFGLTGLLSAERYSRSFETDEARALIAGAAAHSVLPFGRAATAAVAKLFLASAHAKGWPVPRGGAAALSDALVAHLESLGGSIETGRRVRHLSEIPDSRAVLFDTDATQLADIAGDELSNRYVRRVRGFRRGSGTFKVDFLIEGEVPWTSAAMNACPTVHVGGSFEECAAAEAEVARGRHPERPFVLAAQQGVLDSGRAPEGQQLLWAYCHVPAGSTVDMTQAIERQINRFAPGFSDLVVERWSTSPADLEAANPNLVGGDITGGANDLRQLVVRPRVLRPYQTSNSRILLCSAATPPGGGVHGMAGHNAALAALRGPLR